MRLNAREFDTTLRKNNGYIICDAKRNHLRNQRCWKKYRNTQYRSR